MLTKRQKEILDFIKKYIKKNEYSPSIEETRKHFKLRSVSTIHEHIESLKSKGYLKKIDNQARAIQLLKKDNTFEIPILGTITAGQPIEAIEVGGETITITNDEVNKSGNIYALRVSGNSMIKEGIFDGDIIVVRKQSTADDGETVVAIIDENQATLKKIYREKSKFRLQPANPQMLPIFRNEVEIRGIVVKIIRNLKDDYKNSLVYRKREFLNRIKSTNPNSQNQYKRVALSTIRYAGGKSLAVGHVIELLPDNIKKVISPFFGGGSIEIAMSKLLGIEVVGYDIFDILCNYWKFQIEKPNIIYRELKKLKPNRKTFEKIRLVLKDVWNKKVKLNPLTLAVYYVYNFNLSYGPGFMGWTSDIYLDEKKYNRMIEKIRDFRPGNLKVERDDFKNVIKKYNNDFLYCDPPYYIGKDSKMFKGIYPMRNIPVHHNGFPHEVLRDLLKKHRGGFILSYNNCSTIRKYYKEYQHFFPSWQYTMGQGETRIGKNRIKNGDNHIKESHEIIIFCPPKE